MSFRVRGNRRGGLKPGWRREDEGGTQEIRNGAADEHGFSDRATSWAFAGHRAPGWAASL